MKSVDIDQWLKIIIDIWIKYNYVHGKWVKAPIRADCDGIIFVTFYSILSEQYLNILVTIHTSSCLYLCKTMRHITEITEFPSFSRNVAFL